MALVTRIILLIIAVSAVFCELQDEAAIAKLEAFIAEEKQKVNPRYRLQYHVAAPVGWINDPNGFSYYKGRYHLFYQYYPYDSVWGPMHWGHVSSTNLVDWEYMQTALLPDEEMCFSGSAVVQNDRLVLMYTAHKILEHGTNQSQYLAFSDDGVRFEKYEGNPVISSTPDMVDDFRDPKVWQHGDDWYVILGSQSPEGKGRVLLYKSKDLITWEFVNVLAESVGNMGYMWECPDFFELDGRFVLLTSPQGMLPEGDRYYNFNQNGYVVGTFDYDTHEFNPLREFQELDFGHDFYAATTTEHDGRRVLISWFGTWSVPHPEDVDGWAGAMTIVRELHLNSRGTIVMTPVEEMKELRSTEFQSGDWFPGNKLNYGSAVEIIIEGFSGQELQILMTGEEGGEFAKLRWDPTARKISLDRGAGDVRQVDWNPFPKVEFRIFLDTSSIEIFCGEGEVVFSSRVYKLGDWVLTNEGFSGLEFTSYNLRRSVAP